MHFSAEVSETFRHWWRSVQWTLRHQCKKFETLRHQTHGAEVSWVRSVLGPKCPYTGHKNHTRYIYCRGYSQASVTITVIYFDWCCIPHSNLQACVQSLMMIRFCNILYLQHSDSDCCTLKDVMFTQFMLFMSVWLSHWCWWVLWYCFHSLWASVGFLPFLTGVTQEPGCLLCEFCFSYLTLLNPLCPLKSVEASLLN